MCHGSLTFSFWPRVKESLFGNRIGPLISFLRSSSTTMSATDAGLSSDIANTARLRRPNSRSQARAWQLAVMHKNILFVHAMNVVQIASRLMIKDRRSSHQGCFDDGSRSLELGSQNDAASLPKDCRLYRRC